MTIISGDSMELPFDDSSFDLVVCRFLKESLPHRRIVFQEISRVLKPGGRLYLESINGQTLWNFSMDARQRNDFQRSLDSLETIGKVSVPQRSPHHFEAVAHITSLSRPDVWRSDQTFASALGLTASAFQNDSPRFSVAPPETVVAIRIKNSFLANLSNGDTTAESVLFNIIDEGS